MKTAHVLSALALLLLAVAPVGAQTVATVTATSGVSFTDADHTALNADGTPVIAHYELRFTPTSGCAAVAISDLGKPAQDANGLIVAKPVPAFGTLPANCTYTAVLAAVAPTGLEGVTPPTSPFVRVLPKTPATASTPKILP